MTRFFAVLFAFFLLAGAAHAETPPAPVIVPPASMPAGEYNLDPTHASLTWKVSHMGLSNYTARFAALDATLTFDPANASKNKVTATINPASVKTDYPDAAKKDFDKKLAEGEEWFNATKFPAIMFTSTKVEKTGDKTANVTGDLTFLGVTKPVTLAVTYFGGMLEHPFTKGPAMGFSASATIKRSEWGFGAYIPMIGDDVTIQIEAEFTKKPDAAKPE